MISIRFDRFDFFTNKDDVYILPTIKVNTQMEIMDKNFNIQLHFLIWHIRWRWIKGE